MPDATLDPNIVTLIAGFGGAIIGSLVTGLVAGYQNTAARKTLQKAAVFKLMIKSSKIQSDFQNISNTMQESVAEAERNGLKDVPKWVKIPANAGTLEPIKVEPEDLVCLFEAREFSLLQQLVELAMKHGIIVDAFNTYSRLRTELKDLMPVSDVNKYVVGSNLSKEDYLRLQPRFIELNSLVDHLDEKLPKYIRDSRR